MELYFLRSRLIAWTQRYLGTHVEFEGLSNYPFLFDVWSEIRLLKPCAFFAAGALDNDDFVPIAAWLCQVSVTAKADPWASLKWEP